MYLFLRFHCIFSDHTLINFVWTFKLLFLVRYIIEERDISENIVQIIQTFTTQSKVLMTLGKGEDGERELSKT